MKKNEIINIINILDKYYPNVKCSLNFSTPFELVIAVMLSAQCTDERVNKTTPTIFKKCKNIEDYTKISLLELEQIIHPCGFYKNKAKNIKLCAKQVLEKYNGQVPNTMEELLTLPGIGRKSANVILLEIFKIANGIAVDTHVKRISNKLNFSNQTDPLKIEQDLLKIIPQEYLFKVNHLFVHHGRNTCTARNPKCDICPINSYCKNTN